MLIIVLLLLSCQPESDDTNNSGVLHNSLFSEISPEITGIDFTNQLTSDTLVNIFEYLYYYNGGGVAVGDFDGDGLEDIYLGANQSPDKLYRNLGKFQFENITEGSGIQTENTWTAGIAVVDIDNDKDLDIYVSKVAPVSKTDTHNLLYINDGNGNFSEQSKLYGLDFRGYGTQALFLDYDKDGDVDIYLINHSVHSVRSFGHTKQREDENLLSGDKLYQSQLSQGLTTFIDVTNNSGIFSSALGYGLSGAVNDFNQDGWPDIYICNDFHENDYLYINQKDGTFREGIEEWFHQTSKFSMGIDIADINGDGQMDVFTTDMLPYKKQVAMRSAGEDTDKIYKIRKDLGFAPQYARNHLQINRGNNFLDVGIFTGTYATDWSWSILAEDFTHNGHQDLYITNGIVKRPNDLEYIKFLNTQGGMLEDGITKEELSRVLNEMPTQKLPNILFKQNEYLEFSNLKNSFTSTPSFSNGAAYSDLDLDGDLDLITNNINQAAFIQRNNSTVNNFISFKLDDEKTVLGTTIQLIGDNINLKKTHYPVRGYQSSSTQNVHFPLPAETRIDSIIVSWPDGTIKLLSKLELNKIHNLSPNDGEIIVNKENSVDSKQHSITPIPYLHLDNEYADYDHDILIPEKLSAEGQALVVADFTGDGITDLYLGGGKFSEAKLLKGKGDDQYIELDNLDFRKDAKYEDVSAIALDFDKDGDLDLYVVSGGNDVPELNELIQDRLYLNDGNGNLKRLPLSLPYTNGSTVSSGDIDGDGFPELFIGARSIPNAYGLSPYSFLLKNNGGFGLEIIWKKRLGLITDSHIIDFDGDNDNDLLLSGDWMPIMVGENITNLIDFNNSYGQSISADTGLWNGLALADINEDGILDIIGCNVGENFKWKASGEKPVKLEVVDMDANASTESFIFSSYFDEMMPFHSLDKMVQQVPLLKKEYISYIDFSKVRGIDDLTDVAKVESKELTELRSTIYISKGGSYKKTVLPSELQYSSIKDAVVLENRLYYLGNEDRFVTELGDQNGIPAGYTDISFDDDVRFTKPIILDLDPTLKTRNIAMINDRTMIITSYKSLPHLIKVD